jgi:hypothetical protein
MSFRPRVGAFFLVDLCTVLLALRTIVLDIRTIVREKRAIFADLSPNWTTFRPPQPTYQQLSKG